MQSDRGRVSVRVWRGEGREVRVCGPRVARMLQAREGRGEGIIQTKA